MRRRTPVAIGAAFVAAAGLVVAAILAFPTGQPDPRVRGGSGQAKLPLSLQSAVFDLCRTGVDRLAAELDAAQTESDLPDQLRFSTAGSGASFTASIELPGLWRLDADRDGVTVSGSDQGEEPTAATPFLPEAVGVAHHLYDCVSRYRFVDQTTPLASSSQLVQWYKYDTTVLWPCLTAHGLDIGDPPLRADFSDAFRAQSVDPFQGMEISKRTLPHLVAAVQDCPVRPSYLR